MFRLTGEAIDPYELESELVSSLSGAPAGALVSFQGRVRDHNLGRAVTALRYDVYPELALCEGHSVLSQARERFALLGVCAVHRYGALALRDVAVAVVVAAAHREAAFLAARFVIDELKSRLPIWKQESYADGTSEWVGCMACQQHVPHLEGITRDTLPGLVGSAGTMGECHSHG